MRVLVTGASGFIGPHVVARLRSRGHEVRALVRNRELAIRALGTPPTSEVGIWPGWAWGDLRDEASLARALEGAGALVHLAGVVGTTDADLYHEVNDVATGALLRLAARRGARVVLLSSLAAGGPIEQEPEAGARPGAGRPISLYGRSKLAGERHLLELDVPWLVLRPAAVYGPGDHQFLPLFRAARRALVAVPGSPDRGTPLVFVEDLAEVVALAAESELEGLLLPVVGRPRLHLRELLRLLRASVAPPGAPPRGPRVLPIPAALVRAASRLAARLLPPHRLPPTLTPDRVAEIMAGGWPQDAEPLERALGWSAWTPPEEGLARTVGWLRAQRLLRG